MHIPRPAGGLSSRDLLWARLRAWRLGPVVFGLMCAAVLSFQVLAAESRAHWSVAPLYFVLPALAGVLVLVWASGRAAERQPRARKHCPELVEIATRAARENGLPVPSAVSIVGHPVIRVTAHRFPRRTVVVQAGLPLLATLSADELRIELARGLAATAEPNPAAALAVLHKRLQFSGVPALVEAGRDSRLIRRATAFLDRTAQFAADIEERAEQAAVQSAGSRLRAAEAMLASGRTLISFDEFASVYRHLIVRRRRVPRMLFSGWLECREAGYVLPEDRQSFVSAVAEDLRRLHPSLDGEFAHLAEQEPADAAVPVLITVPPTLERSLARAYAKSFLSGNAAPKLVEWENVDPAKVYGQEAATEPVIEAAATVLKRPATAVDVLELLSTGDGRRELTRTLVAESDVTVVGDPDEALRPGVAATGAVVHELLTHGYRRLDALHHHRLTAPDGSVLDANTVTAEALTSPEALEHLCGLLRTASQRSV
ncbi:hypothetical protein [Streptacidiphilus sp. MAP5-3]|uniref:hypothetical protein n=1 Tax=unclassified Streptacidiphilus TaxID=2643834 RepID=UPI003514BF5C